MNCNSYSKPPLLRVFVCLFRPVNGFFLVKTMVPLCRVGCIVGFVFSSILLSVVASAINTIIVCYAEAPAEFQANHPQLSAEMREAWVEAWPNLSV